MGAGGIQSITVSAGTNVFQYISLFLPVRSLKTSAESSAYLSAFVLGSSSLPGLISTYCSPLMDLSLHSL